MNMFLKYKEKLYEELIMFHTWDTNSQQELYNYMKSKGITTVDGMMKHMFDYAFKCGIRRALDLIENKEELSK